MSNINKFELHGACCANGIIRAKKAIAAVDSGSKVTINLATHTAEVISNADPDAIVVALQNAKFEASFIHQQSSADTDSVSN